MQIFKLLWILCLTVILILVINLNIIDGACSVNGCCGRGRFQDPNDKTCRNYIFCIPSNKNPPDLYIVYNFTCPNDYTFRQSTQTCVRPSVNTECIASTTKTTDTTTLKTTAKSTKTTKNAVTTETVVVVTEEPTTVI